MPMGVQQKEKHQGGSTLLTHGLIMQTQCQKENPHQPFAKPVGVAKGFESSREQLAHPMD